MTEEEWLRMLARMLAREGKRRIEPKVMLVHPKTLRRMQDAHRVACERRDRAVAALVHLPRWRWLKRKRLVREHDRADESARVWASMLGRA